MKNFARLLACLTCGIAIFEAQAQDTVSFGRATVLAGGHPLDVELATTPAQLERGLMARTSLPEDGGMLFIFSPPREVFMWMKNTILPLDMVFVSDAHRIIRIEENTTPQSLHIIPSNGQTAAVLELPAGKAGQLDLAPGDTVTWTIPLPDARK